jgi:hypothetical protein
VGTGSRGVQSSGGAAEEQRSIRGLAINLVEAVEAGTSKKQAWNP